MRRVCKIVGASDVIVGPWVQQRAAHSYHRHFQDVGYYTETVCTEYLKRERNFRDTVHSICVSKFLYREREEKMKVIDSLYNK